MKILAIQFKYFGDAVCMIPALRAIRDHFQECELHALVPQEVAPVFDHLPWLNRVWAMPRERGRAHFHQSWSFIRSLRGERFDRSVEFGGNDRGAILSFLCGARQKLGLMSSGGFIGRRFCYTQRVPPAPLDRHETLRLLHLISGWGIAPAQAAKIEIPTDPTLDAVAAKLVPERKIFFHVATGQQKKDWPLQHWVTLHQMASAAGFQVVFTTGKGAREQSLTVGLKSLAPSAQVLPPVPDLATFLALLKRARVLVCGDTGPLHFAAGLGVPTIALFGPTSAARWAPAGQPHRSLTVNSCACGPNVNICQNASRCLATILPEQVLDCLQTILELPVKS
jgi:heptosyltransferase-3